MYRFVTSLVFFACTSIVSPAAAMEAGQTYVAVQGGISQPESNDFKNAAGARVSTKSEDGFVVIGAVGRSYNKNLRAEVEGGYRAAAVDNHSITGPALAGSEGQTKVASAMVNGYYDMPTSASIKPYIGGGVGVARVEFDDHATTANGVLLNAREVVPAFQGMAGLHAPVSARLSVNAEYRYFTTAKINVQSGTPESNTSYNTHNVTLGARYAF